MLLDGPGDGCNDVDASAELAVEDPLPNDKTALMRAAARGDVAEARRYLDERGGETPVAGLRLCTLRREVARKR